MPSELKAVSYFEAASVSKIKSGFALQCSQPLSLNSSSNCPGAQPAYPRASKTWSGPVPSAIAFKISMVAVSEILSFTGNVWLFE